MKTRQNFRIYRRRGILYLYSYHIVTFKKFYISTGIPCPDKYWDDRKRAIKVTNRTSRRIVADLERFIEDAQQGVEILNEKGLTVNTRNLNKVLHDNLDEDFLKEYRDAVLSAPVRESTRKKKLSTLKRLREYAEYIKQELTYAHFRKDEYQKFYNWLSDTCDLTDSTVRKHIKELRWFFNNKRSGMDIEHIKYPTVSSSSYFLTDRELKILYEAELTGQRDVWRDYLVFMCYTGMRISDAVRMNPSWITIDEKLIRYRQKKTNTEAFAPITSRVKDIIDKRDGALPRISGQKLNKGLKKLLRELEIDRVVEDVKKRKGENESRFVPICDLVSSHVGRRTFINRCIRRGVPLDIIALMTGHKQIGILEHYKKIYASDVSALVEQLD